MAHLDVDLVAADRTIWSGEARMVSAPSAEGEVGILPGHTPLLAVLRPGEVRITPSSGETVRSIMSSSQSVAGHPVAPPDSIPAHHGLVRPSPPWSLAICSLSAMRSSQVSGTS